MGMSISEEVAVFFYRVLENLSDEAVGLSDNIGIYLPNYTTLHLSRT
jgi:hypothetical protein